MKALNLFTIFIFLLSVFSCSSAQKSTMANKDKPLIEIRFYLIDESKNPQSLILTAPKGEKAYLALPPFITENDFASARLTDGMFRKYDILIELTSEGGKKMEETTRKYLKKQTAVTIDGQIITMPFIQQEIKGNMAIITGEPDENKTRAIVEKINKMVEERKKKE